ncbi:TNF receptor-associated factor 3 [Hydra vulgaris]|uniref:TNF receptor-associated factor 3 n=1 Tax=Hydra vulgaris TaxID=6087 RepID=UPI001F5F516B|nr:TNF receptor-associated factor 3-like [Hydra vulgaris]
MRNHTEIKCIYRLVTCQYCSEKMLFCEMQNHLETCKRYCVNECGIKVLSKEMSSHITNSCANTIISCQYSYIGCNFKGMRKEQGTHVNSSTQNHLSKAISKVAALENEIIILKNERNICWFLVGLVVIAVVVLTLFYNNIGIYGNGILFSKFFYVIYSILLFILYNIFYFILYYIPFYIFYIIIFYIMLGILLVSFLLNILLMATR